MWRQWSSRVTLLRHTAPEPTGEQLEQLAARGIAVVEGEVAAVEVAGDRLAGVWVAGNVADVTAGVMVAAASGVTAAAAVNADLIAEDTARAVAAARA